MLGYRLLFTAAGALFWVLLGWNVLRLEPGTNFGMALVLALVLWALGGIVGQPLNLTQQPDQAGSDSSR